MIQPTYGDFANGFHQLYHLTITFVTRYHARHQENSACGIQQLTWNLKNTHLEKDYSSSKPTCLGFHASFPASPPKVFLKSDFRLICILSLEGKVKVHSSKLI